jgi:hypothetical protein
VGEGHFSSVTSVHGVQNVLNRFLKLGDVSQQLPATPSKPKKVLAAAGARMPLARDHFADFRLAASCCFFLSWDLNFAAWF